MPSTRAVHVEQRQPVDQHVVPRPLPGGRERVEVRGDGAPRQHDALGRPRRAGGVDDERGRLGVGLPGWRLGLGVDVDVDARDPGGGVGHRRVRRREEQRRGAVGEDVLELALAGLRVDGHHRHAGQQRADDGDARLQLRHGPHRDPRSARGALGHGARRAGERAVGERPRAEAERLAPARAGEGGEQRRGGAVVGNGHRGLPLRAVPRPGS
jgi:hypothetical protein